MQQAPDPAGPESSPVCAQAPDTGKPLAKGPEPSEPLYTVAVTSLCEFSARRGDLDLRFTPSPSAQQGREGHLLVPQRRGESYESEIRLTE